MPNHIRQLKYERQTYRFQQSGLSDFRSLFVKWMLAALVLAVLIGTGLAFRQTLLSIPATDKQASLAALQERNRQLQQEVERLKSAVQPADPKSIKINALIERINTIEQHQNALMEAIRGPQPPKGKQSLLEDIEKSEKTDEIKLGQLEQYLTMIEAQDIALAKSLTERSENNARILTMMLSSVSDRLVPQKLFGKEPTGNRHNMGGPLIGLRQDKSHSIEKAHGNEKESGNPDFPLVLTNAIAMMQQHAQLYNTLINLPLARPLLGDAQYISGFGNRTDPFTRQPAFHGGIDLKQNPGSAILSTGAGIVIHAGPADGYGNMVEVAHAGGVTTRYGHLSRILVSVGEPIVTGQKVGLLGNTGRSTGAHLHYETRIRDQAVNPIPFLQMGERLRGLDLNQSNIRFE